MVLAEDDDSARDKDHGGTDTQGTKSKGSGSGLVMGSLGYEADSWVLGFHTAGSGGGGLRWVGPRKDLVWEGRS